MGSCRSGAGLASMLSPIYEVDLFLHSLHFLLFFLPSHLPSRFLSDLLPLFPLLFRFRIRINPAISISLILRRSTMMSWSSDMDAYLNDLQMAQVSPSDGFFCELVRIEHLYHTMDQQFFLSDRHQSASARDPNTIWMAEDFRSRLNSWRSRCDLNWLQRGE